MCKKFSKKEPPTLIQDLLEDLQELWEGLDGSFVVEALPEHERHNLEQLVELCEKISSEAFDKNWFGE